MLLASRNMVKREQYSVADQLQETQRTVLLCCTKSWAQSATFRRIEKKFIDQHYRSSAIDRTTAAALSAYRFVEFKFKTNEVAASLRKSSLLSVCRCWVQSSSVDPNFHFDADPDPDPDWHQNDVDPHADPTLPVYNGLSFSPVFWTAYRNFLRKK
jgi:hypothetical protein